MPTTHTSRFQIWFPFGFAALLSAMKMLLPSGAGDPAFYCFLPMCFLFAAQSQIGLMKRIDALQSSIARTESPAPAPE